MLLFSFIVLTLPCFLLSIPDKFDGKCDQLADQKPFCLGDEKLSFERTYASWTILYYLHQLQAPKVVDLSKKCTPVMFYVVSRHATLYPSRSEIEETGQVLTKLQADLAKSYDQRSDEMCFADYQHIRSWKNKMDVQKAGKIAPGGADHTVQLAREFYERYPSLFDPETVTFNVEITRKNRTKETAEAFIDGIKAYVPTISEKLKYEVRDYLEFNDICLKKIGIQEPPPKMLEAITTSELFIQLRKRMSKRMGLKRVISQRELQVIYRTCAFEQAILYTDTWCALFTKLELDALEIREDVAEYYKNGPGSPISKRMACPVLANLYRAVTQAIRNPEERFTHLKFADTAAMTRIMNFFGLKTKLDLHDNFCPKKQHSFRSAEILPANANFNVVLYRCSKDPDTTNPGDYKLVTTVNGNTVEIDKCDGKKCNGQKFLNAYKELAKGCDLDEVCPQAEFIGDDFDDEN